MIRSISSIVAIIVIGSILLSYAAISGNHTASDKIGMFSWKSDVFQDGGAELFAFMKKNGFTELYQAFSSKVSSSAVTEFLTNAKKEKIDVYTLTGDPSWALDSKGKSICEAVERAEEILQSTSGGIKGIVFDIEPHTISRWSKDAKSIMESYSSGMKIAYSKAAKAKLEVIICIPYYYDEDGITSALKSLIRTGCDRVAIMNYYKSREAEHIETEVKYAQRYGKGVINIYEFKAVGQRGIREVNTYNTDGFDAALKSYGLIAATYPDADIMLAAHDYEALKGALK